MLKKDSSEKDFYIDENGLYVFTREFHLRRGFCCKNNCRHCPYKGEEEEKVAE